MNRNISEREGCSRVSESRLPIQPTCTGRSDLDTKLRGGLGRAPSFEQSRALLQRVREVGAAGPRIVMLPESAAGLWTPTTGGFWTDGLRDTEITVVAGAAIVDREGHDNAMMAISSGRTQRLYSERIPVPVSMWRP